MKTLEDPITGTGVDDTQFSMTRTTKSLLIHASGTLHKQQFWEINSLGVSQAILGIDFLEAFESCQILFDSQPRLILSIPDHPPLIFPLYTCA